MVELMHMKICGSRSMFSGTCCSPKYIRLCYKANKGNTKFMIRAPFVIIIITMFACDDAVYWTIPRFRLYEIMINTRIMGPDNNNNNEF